MLQFQLQAAGGATLLELSLFLHFLYIQQLVSCTVTSCGHSGEMHFTHLSHQSKNIKILIQSFEQQLQMHFNCSCTIYHKQLEERVCKYHT